MPCKIPPKHKSVYDFGSERDTGHITQVNGPPTPPPTPPPEKRRDSSSPS